MIFCLRNGVWETGVVWHSSDDPANTGPALGTVKAADSVVLVAKDQEHPEGNRSVRPGDERWAFLGVESGEPFWWYMQTNTGGLWPGFNVCGRAEAYPNPTTGDVQAWKKLHLVDVRSRGEGDGQIAMWDAGALGELNVWMSSADGIDESDAYWIGNSGHSHPATGFSALGLYEVTLAMRYHPEGTMDFDEEVVSPPVPFYYAVGTYWTWVADHFAPATWWEAGMAGEQDDPDGDGIPNLVEYAYGLDPTKPDVRTYADEWTLGLPAGIFDPDGSAMSLRMPMRDRGTNPQISYIVEGSADLSVEDWPEQYPLNPSQVTDILSGWEEFHLDLPVAPPGRPDWFLRTRIELDASIDYPE